MSTVWAVPPSRFLQASRILTFLREKRCSERGLEVRIFKTSRKAQIASRHWEAGSDLAMVAQEIATYIAEHGSVEATIIAADELLRPPPRRPAKPRSVLSQGCLVLEARPRSVIFDGKQSPRLRLPSMPCSAAAASRPRAGGLSVCCGLASRERSGP